MLRLKHLMADTSNPLIKALEPILSRVRTDVTAVKVADGSSRWTKDPLTTERVAQHLNGGPARGVCPIKAGESVTMLGLLDFDSHGGETSWEQMSFVAGQVMDQLILVHGASPTAFRSSGGRGIHVYVLWDEPQDAYSVRQWLGGVLADCGLKDGAKGVAKGQVEVFPRQNQVALDGNGNQFILPLSGKSVLLDPEELSGMLVAATDARGLEMRSSYPVPVLTKPNYSKLSETANSVVTGAETWRQALDAMANTGESELGYDDWFRVVCGIHHEMGGSADGLALAHTWSARSPKYDPSFLDERVWPYIKSGEERGEGGATAVTGGTIRSIATRVSGWHAPVDLSAFHVITDAEAYDGKLQPPPSPAPVPIVVEVNGELELLSERRQAERLTNADRVAEAIAMVDQPIDRRGVPEAKHLCTDQANAMRLMKAFGSGVFVSAGRWYVWDGRRWKPDESDIYRFACRLSVIIHEEAKQIVLKARQRVEGDGNAERVARAEKVAEALDKWAVKSEMKGTIEAAIGLLRKMLTVEPELLDKSPWLLNCRNGTVDLRTGLIGPHKADDFITKLVDLDYNPAVRSSLWERTLLQIARDTAVAEFLKRWFGYCATGDVREQVFVVHWGDGSNGKSTVLDTVSNVLSDYAGAAAPNLMAGGSGDRHPTEIADLKGRRMVTAHESKEGVSLNEDFVKRATGGDKMKARLMGENFFEFFPTHKLQLLTNAKPTIRGQDHGIWRRVCLVAYTARFGSLEKVLSGEATDLKDMDLLTRLSTKEALQGVLTWLVEGAVEWLRDGLNPPAAVLEASTQYRVSQDRVREFVSDCCEVGAGFKEPVTAGMFGLYPAYKAWCVEAGMHALARGRFITELDRVVPGLSKSDGKVASSDGKRRNVQQIIGIRLLPE